MSDKTPPAGPTPDGYSIPGGILDEMADIPHQRHVNSAWETATCAGVGLDTRALVLANLAVAEAQHTANLIAVLPHLPQPDRARLRKKIAERLGLAPERVGGS